MGRVLFITSFKGGVGKTTVSANLSALLARMGHRVLAVDGDMGMRCMDMALGDESGCVYSVADVLAGECAPERAVVESGSVKGLYFMASPAQKPDMIPDREKFLSLFRKLREEYDYVIIDSSAEETPYYLSFAACADDAVVVCMHQSISVRAAEKTGLRLQDMGFRSVRLAVNCYRASLARAGELPTVAQMIDGSAIRLIGVIPRDDNVVIEGDNIVIHDEYNDATEAVIPVKAWTTRDIVEALCEWLDKTKKEETKALRHQIKALVESTNMTKLKLMDYAIRPK